MKKILIALCVTVLFLSGCTFNHKDNSIDSLTLQGEDDSVNAQGEDSAKTADKEVTVGLLHFNTKTDLRKNSLCRNLIMIKSN